MPRNKKKWIDKKHSETFRLIHRSLKDPLIVDGNIGNHVLQPLQKKNMEEHIKCGIYFDDDYNYLQHLRSLGEVSAIIFFQKVTEHEKVERTIIKAPAGKANLPSTLFETSGYELTVGLLSQAASSGLEINIDPEVAAALEGNFDFENPDNALEDDFIINANGGDLPSLHPPAPLPVRRDEFRTGTDGIDEDSDRCSEGDTKMDDDGSGQDSYDNDDEMSGDDLPAGVQRSEKQRFIDEQFEKFCEEYSDAVDEETDEEEENCLLDPNSDRMKMLAEEFKNNKQELILKKDEVAMRYEAEEVGEELKQIAIDAPDKKKAKWDCESIVSTYSNIYNRPALIVDSSRKRKLKPILKQIEKINETHSLASRRSVSTVRSRGETTEERKARKAVVKEMRAERRAEKKCNKLAFKEERKKVSARRSEPALKTVPIV